MAARDDAGSDRCHAAGAGPAFARTRVLGDDAAVFTALAEWVHLAAETP